MKLPRIPAPVSVSFILTCTIRCQPKETSGRAQFKGVLVFIPSHLGQDDKFFWQDFQNSPRYRSDRHPPTQMCRSLNRADVRDGVNGNHCGQ